MMPREMNRHRQQKYYQNENQYKKHKISLLNQFNVFAFSQKLKEFGKKFRNFLENFPISLKRQIHFHIP